MKIRFLVAFLIATIGACSLDLFAMENGTMENGTKDTLPSWVTLAGYPPAGSKEETAFILGQNKQIKQDHEAAQELQDEILAQELQGEQDLSRQPRQQSYFTKCRNFLWNHKKKVLVGSTVIGFLGYLWYRHSKS